jgi:hypothetical protein
VVIYKKKYSYPHSNPLLNIYVSELNHTYWILHECVPLFLLQGSKEEEKFQLFFNGKKHLCVYANFKGEERKKSYAFFFIKIQISVKK